MRASAAWMETHQVVLLVAALAAGASAGMLIGAPARASEVAITPLLALLLYATFLGVPFARLGRALLDGRFVVSVVCVNFVAVPAIVWALSRFVASDEVVLVAVLFVLLTPCVDYVIAFAGLAGGSRDRLLAVTPLLLLLQIVLLPLYLWVFVGPGFVDAIDLAPFVEVFVWLILVPLAAAAVTQVLAGRVRVFRLLGEAVLSAMVPLTMLTLFVVVASQIPGVGARWSSLLGVVPLYVAFAAAMVALGVLASRVARLDAPRGRAVVFSGVTRNSLVILPLVLALPEGFELAPLIVVTQTLVELVLLVVLVRLVPRLMPLAEPRTEP